MEDLGGRIEGYLTIRLKSKVNFFVDEDIFAFTELLVSQIDRFIV
jgi:hypothetical protein